MYTRTSVLIRLTGSAHDAEQKPRTRVQSTHEASTRFTVPTRTYQQQYSDMYYMRLAKLKPVVMALAQEAWEDFEVRWLVHGE